MDKPFIYIFTLDARDKLLENGFTLLKSDLDNNLFIFAADDSIPVNFSWDNVIYINTDTLLF